VKHRGFAILLVLVALAIVGALVWSITVWSRGRITTATHAIRDAQLEQLLLAGMDAGPAMLQQGKEHLDISAPAETGARLSLDRLSGTSQVVVTVEYAGVQRQQTARYTRSGDTWRLTELAP
jgi:hypothetical protein